MGEPKRGVVRTCGNCGRVCKWDIDRRHCPVTASPIHAQRPADKCAFYVADTEKTGHRPHQSRREG